MRKRFTPKELAFVEAYLACDGDGTEAAARAGYSASSRRYLGRIGSVVLNRPHVREAIRERVQAALDGLVKSREARLRWLSSVVNSKTDSTRDKLKAMALLCRCVGDLQADALVSVSVANVRVGPQLADLSDAELAAFDVMLEEAKARAVEDAGPVVDVTPAAASTTIKDRMAAMRAAANAALPPGLLPPPRPVPEASPPPVSKPPRSRKPREPAPAPSPAAMTEGDVIGDLLGPRDLFGRRG